MNEKIIRESGNFSLFHNENGAEIDAESRRDFLDAAVANSGVYYRDIYIKHVVGIRHQCMDKFSGNTAKMYLSNFCVICDDVIPSNLIKERDLLNSMLRYET